MYFHEQIDIEEAERERKYLDSIGMIGRAIDNHWHYLLLLCFICGVGFCIGLGIGLLL